MTKGSQLAKAIVSKLGRGLVAVATIGGLTGCNLPRVVSTNPEISAQVSSIVASDGSLITTVPTDIFRLPVPYSALGTYLPEAAVAIEDKRYWIRGPIDVRSIIRAAVANVSAGAVEQGGSTIEEQLVKLELGTPKRTLPEKLHEILLSLGSLEGTSKQKVLASYLNDVYLGEGAYGAQAASMSYFAKPAADLDLSQAALLAGLINAPSAYDPLVNPNLATQRRNIVLAEMYAQGEISLQSYQGATSAGLELAPNPAAALPKLGYFSQQVMAEAQTLPALGATLPERIRMIEHGGLKIVTTEIPADQLAAHQSLARAIPVIKQQPSGALVSIDPANGAIVALVGGLGYDNGSPASQFNMATQAQRPAGSTFKVIALAEALSQGIDPAKIFYAPPRITIPASNGQPAWTVSNYEGEPFGYMTLQTATILSVNTVYAQLIKEVGSTNVVRLAHAMGVQSNLQAYDSIVLGAEPVTPLDMASVFATIANYGIYNKPYSISAIYNATGNLIYQHQLQGHRAISSVVAATEIQILHKVTTEGTGVNAAIGRPLAGKTGTGENWADAWFGGFVPQLATVVWVGYPQGEIPMIPPSTPIYVVGGSWPALAFSFYNVSALEAMPALAFRTPSSFETPISQLPIPNAGAPLSGSLTNVVGMPSAVAQSSLVNRGFRINVVFAPSGEYPPGYAIAQTPAPGSRLTPNDVVTITISNGTLIYPSLVSVPDMLGMSAPGAALALQSVGLVGQCQFAQSPPPTLASTLPNEVWEQSPAPGTQVGKGSQVSCVAEPT